MKILRGEANKMSDNIKTAITLFLITLISGLALGAVYGVTKEPIELANQQATMEAYQSLIPGAADYQEKTDDPSLTAAADDSVTVDSLVVAVDESGADMGYIVTVTSHSGYGGDIQMTVGYAEQDGGCRPRQPEAETTLAVCVCEDSVFQYLPAVFGRILSPGRAGGTGQTVEQIIIRVFHLVFSFCL